MSDGRRKSKGQPIPLATQVEDGLYCFSHQGRQEQATGFRLLCAGRERCLPSYHVSRNEFACTVVEYVANGLGKLRVGSYTRDLYSGVVFAYGMDSPHDVWADSKYPMTKYFAAYEAIPSSSASATAGRVTEGVRWTRDLEVMQTLFDELINEGRNAGPCHERITSLYLELILSKAGSAVQADAVKQSGSHETYEHVRMIIDERYQEVSSLGEISRISGVAPNYICRVFRKYDTETPHQRLVRHKLNHAAELLATTTQTVTEIAREIGFEDPFYFSRAFKKRYGLPPSQFRRVDH